MKKIFLIILVSTATLFAQSAGNSGVSFLKNGFGARNIAMSDLGVVGVTDLTALNYNPALLSKYKAPQVMLTHNQSIQDMTTQLVGASFSLWGIPFAVGVNNTSINDIEVRTQPGEPQSLFNAHYMFGSLSTGFEIFQNLSLGITTKFIYENLFSDEAEGWAFDFGLSYSDIVDGLDLGASIKNIGSLSELRNEATILPTDLRVGLSYGFTANSINSEVILIGGVQKYSETDDTHIHTGGEVFYDNIIAVRFGYMTGYESKGFTTGLGLYWEGLNFDYAFTPYSRGLGSAHTISLMYSFN
ncbi:MAG: PorV/PorQ family protein [Melioribacteraceae bacterium]|nr:PorV/PorQ family protein [Melioribacteraceae bacterium]